MPIAMAQIFMFIECFTLTAVRSLRFIVERYMFRYLCVYESIRKFYLLIILIYRIVIALLLVELNRKILYHSAIFTRYILREVDEDLQIGECHMLRCSGRYVF